MKYTIFGESHGPAIGVTLTGVPAGIALDPEEIGREMARRAPGQNDWSTPRKEADRPEILSGVFEGKTTGSPLCAVIANGDTRSGDYARTKDLARPGHADYPAFVRYGGCNDYRGGGHFSGRLTAPLVFAGAVAKQILALREVRVRRPHQLHLRRQRRGPGGLGQLRAAADKPFPVLDDAKGEEMRAAIAQAREEQDSVGGSIECAVFGLPAGLGSPDFGENAEGIFSQYLFAVPAVKAVAFGAGNRLLPHAGLRGQRPAVHGRRRQRPGGAELRRRHQRRHHQRHAPGV